MFLLLFGHGLRGSTKVHQNSAGSAFDALAARCARFFHASSTFSPQRCANPDSAPRPKFSSSKRLRSRVRAAGCTGCVIFSRGGTSVRASPLSPQPTYLCRSGCASTAPLEVSVAPSGFYLQPHGAPPPLPARARGCTCQPILLLMRLLRAYHTLCCSSRRAWQLCCRCTAPHPLLP